jgi:hypothetical protein
MKRRTLTIDLMEGCFKNLLLMSSGQANRNKQILLKMLSLTDLELGVDTVPCNTMNDSYGYVTLASMKVIYKLQCAVFGVH